MHGRAIIWSCICIGICLGHVWAVPAARPRRQVVQPLWLMRPDLLPSSQAARVSVTPQKLQETADIRASIQKAVNEGTYVVAASPQQFLSALGQVNSPGAAVNPFAMPVLPAFTLPNATWWRPCMFLFAFIPIPVIINNSYLV
ncbi:uncharacterized protein [Drosophila virilis]|uniref:uncharacterized protein isoform X1 n=1 Tax=Drosophila virilis TaxID=7244 RepID=UPI001395D1F3|nr:uncharacterized protein LOC6633346 isoform X1 [Drosophila virilis]